MATETNCLTAGPGEDSSQATESHKDPPTCLTLWSAPLPPQSWISRTARYANDPAAYLVDALGQTVFDARKTLLSIPETIDKDMYGTGAHKSGFEQHIATLLGKAHGLFFLTGVQAQLTALKIYCNRAGKNKVAWHVTSHLETAEFKSSESLYGLERVLLGSDSKANPTVSEIKKVLSLPPSERPAVIVLEIPNRVLGCKAYSFGDLEEISEACRASNVILHCDGARLWDIEPYYHETADRSFSEIGKLFDSVYVSFYKGLGGAAGSVLVHDDSAFMDEAKVWQRRAGGNAVTLMYELIDCERGYNENIGTFDAKWKKMVDITDKVKTATAKFQTDSSRPVLRTIPDDPICDQIHMLFEGYTADQLLAARDKVQEKSNVRVFERLWPKKTLDENPTTYSDKEGDKNGLKSDPETHEERSHEMEWGITNLTMNLDTEVFVRGYVALCEELSLAGSKTAAAP